MSTHLSLPDRRVIEQSLNAQLSLKTIAKQLEKATSTISREIRKHRKISLNGAYGRVTNRCIHRTTCDVQYLCEDKQNCLKRCRSCKKCNSLCSLFAEQTCAKLDTAPYVCNGCPDRNVCVLKKYFYVASSSDAEYRHTLSEARIGFNMVEDELNYIDEICSPLIKQGQSVYHILSTHRNDISISSRSLYRLVSASALSARNVDMPRVCRFKPRRGKPKTLKIDRDCRINRTYDDFKLFMSDNANVGFAEIDSVIGRIGGKVLLTIHIKSIDFMLAFIRDHNSAASVGESFAFLREVLPYEVYHNLFYVLLADNGSEFSAPSLIELDSAGNTVSKLFYCNPQSPFQKPNVELNHEFIRRCLPKGSSFDALTQKDVDKMMSHINSYGREKFGGSSPAQLFVQLFGEEALRLLRQKIIPSKKILLKPKIFTI